MPDIKLPINASSPEMTARTERELRQHNTRHRVTERRRIVQKLRQSLATNELALHFQPVVSLTSGLAKGAEAMLRINHARRGLIPAAHFLPLVEQSDIIVEVGGWALNAVCREIPRLPGHFCISLALSSRHLQSGKLVRHLLEALGSSGIAPERLELLITEAMMLDEDEESIFALKAVLGLGVRLGLNQFGTGYASLAPLKRLPFSTLRLAKSLAFDLCDDQAPDPMVQAAIEAGHALKCTVLADGVESDSQYRAFCRMGADEGQGQFFGPATSGAALARMFKAK